MIKIKIYKSYKLASLTTLKIGGRAEYFCMPNSISQVKDAYLFAKDNNLKTYIIGNGSNILISDHGLKGLVISTKKLNKYSFNKNIIVAEAGISVNKLNKKIIKHSLTGMEFTGGLPGSIGGAVFMNARAYGREMSNIVSLVCAIKKNEELLHFTNSQINFSYKQSIFENEQNLFILSVTLELKKSTFKKIKSLYKQNKKDRIKKGQFKFPSAGCIFKNNYDMGIPSGKIIDEVGLKGKKIGGAQISENHGNFIINTNNAKAEDIKKLIELIEEKVYKEKGIKLQREIRLLGF